MSFRTDKIRVGVLRGGPSPEYEVSLKTGQNILKNLEEKYIPIDIFISKEGIWHENGFEKNHENILKKIDLAINGMHGTYGEDGTIQKLFEAFNVPYTGSNSISSNICMNKVLSKKIYERNGIKTPFYMSIPFENLSRQAILEVYKNVPAPFVVKPSSSGSSVGVHIAYSLAELEEAVVASSHHSPAVLIEEMIKGKEATCGVIDGFRNLEYYPLLPIEIRHKKDFFDYDAKYSDSATEEICPGNFNQEESDKIKQFSIDAHKALGLRHYSRSDFIIHPKRGIFILETNSLPGLTEQSLIPKSLNAIGSNLKEFLNHIIDLTRNKN
jgi:D-alanine-D-alanine ligase